MNIIDVIEHKRNALTLTREELDFAFNGYLRGEVEDYQMSSLLMAICINGMDFSETKALTDLMIESGVKLDTSKINGLMVDKHSTGGVGDKTTFIIGPILASLGLKFGKMSGRGLGITGGTIDKLESIPGIRTSLTEEEFIHILNNVGLVITSQTPNMTPLDKVIYELRDVTGTVSSIPLIASSIMSKKIAVGAKYILIDIKVGEGALLKTHDEAKLLADTLVQLGNAYNRCVIPVLTDMNTPLGDAVGNALEVKEAIDILKGKKNALANLCIELSSILYSQATNKTIEDARIDVTKVINNGDAYKKFNEFISSVGGNLEEVQVSNNVESVQADKTGKITSISALEIGKLTKSIGAGRKKKGDAIYHDVGIVLKKRVGDDVKEGDILCEIYKRSDVSYAIDAKNAFTIVK